MNNRIQFVIYLFCFALFVQTFYPAYQINVNLVEVTENSEENTPNFKKKVPLQIHSEDFQLLCLFTNILDKNFFDNQDHLQPQWYQDIWTPPPRVA